MTFEQLIALPRDNAKQCKAFLRALHESEWQYHIDDDAREIFGNDKGLLLHRAVLTCGVMLKGWDNVWRAYHK